MTPQTPAPVTAQDARRDAGRRRHLLGALAFAPAAATLAVPLLSRQAVAQAAPTDADILNFALNLEYLEAEFYLRAAYGRGLDATEISGTGTLGPVIGGSKVPFVTPAVREYAEEIALDERNHVNFLRGALGSAAVARPKINLRNSFNMAARMAGLVGPQDTFDPFADEVKFLLGAFLFEDVGVTAYKGAAPLVASKDILAATAGLLAVEAYHAGEVRTLLSQLGRVDEARKLSQLRDRADGPGDLDQGIRRGGKANIVPTDDNGLAFSRSPSQVLGIVYLGGASAGFGFFPDRANGVLA